jgi:hypothetical protein
MHQILRFVILLPCREKAHTNEFPVIADLFWSSVYILDESASQRGLQEIGCLVKYARSLRNQIYHGIAYPDCVPQNLNVNIVKCWIFFVTKTSLK